MDDESIGPEPAPWQIRFKDVGGSLWSWVERWNDPKAKQAVRAGAWTVRALKWREQSARAKQQSVAEPLDERS